MEDSQRYWVSCPVPHPNMYPLWMYHQTQPPRMVRGAEEEKALMEQGFSNTYIYREWPKMAFKAGETPRTVETPEDWGKLGSGWSDKMPPEEPATKPAPAPTPTSAPASSTKK
jgi:hypothetical protein